MPNKAIMRLVRDEESHTGLSAAILIRNVRPHKSRNGRTVLANANFTANFSVNCDGYKVKPKVRAMIECQLNPLQLKSFKRKLTMERAFAGSPMLK